MLTTEVYFPERLNSGVNLLGRKGAAFVTGAGTGACDQRFLLVDFERRRDRNPVPALGPQDGSPDKRGVHASAFYASFLECPCDSINILGRFNAGGDQSPGGRNPCIGTIYHGAPVKLPGEQWHRRLIGGLQTLSSVRQENWIFRPEHTAMLISDGYRRAPPSLKVSDIVRFAFAAVLHARLEQPNLAFRIELIPIKPLRMGVCPCGIGALQC